MGRLPKKWALLSETPIITAGIDLTHRIIMLKVLNFPEISDDPEFSRKFGDLGIS